ncbi:hypothetical protein KIH74_17465 [Kineosporia sp. J2-2]|uniref:P68 RBP/TagC-like beta-propeller domain-containing protein n=1 Tax=Kineosporia corallincola TaxID=2835133 RepID=A0ABS5TI16_9ACTN|nr:hypothetical protein [Kineosporia corallincola]MBT0770736.1 hypothetical protein [Kineosporia corallincola]
MSRLISRRNLLLAGGGTLGAALAGGATASPASAAVAGTVQFDLTVGATQLIREKELAGPKVLQSFGIDNVNDRIYWAQLSNNDGDGDLTITKTDLSGARIGPDHVYLKGFGHGVQIAVQPDGGGAYVWVEAAADSKGFGTKIARFRFNDFDKGQTLTASSSGVEIFDPRPDGTNKSITIDPYWKRVAIRYIQDDVVYYRLYTLAAFADHDYGSPLAEVAPGNFNTFQGLATFGSYLYLLTGNAYSDGYGDVYDGKLADGSYADGNTYLRTVDWNTGTVVKTSLSKAGYTLYYREPEGMAVQMTDPSDVNSARLCFGFASGAEGERRASVYYKKGFV